MALPSSGPIRLGADVNVELGLGSTTQISLGQASVRGLYGVASGAIRLAANGYGKVNRISGTQQGGKLVGTPWQASATYISQNSNGVSISGNGNTVVMGGTRDGDGIGAVVVFVRSGTTWSQQAKLIGTGNIGGLVYQGFSTALSLDGNKLFVGGPYDNNNAGTVWEFTRSGTSWTQTSKITATGGVVVSPNGRNLGFSMVLSSDGTTLAVGGSYNVWIFINSGGTWIQQGVVNDGSTTAALQFGKSCAISSDGNTLAVGVYTSNKVLVYTRSGSNWSLQASLTGSGGVGTSQSQGYSCSLSADGNTVIIGGFSDNSAAGAVWTFTRSGTTWTQLGSKLSSPTTTSNFGQSVSISGDGTILAVGSPRVNSFSGAISLYIKNGSTWDVIISNKNGTGEFGSSLDLSNDATTLIVGAPADTSFRGAAWILI